MRNIFIFTFIVIASCSAPKLYHQGVNKIARAIEKDPSIQLPIDTTIITTTLTKFDTVDNVIIKTITNTIEIVRDTCNFDCDQLKTIKQLRIEKQIAKDSLRHNEKMYKLQTDRMEDSLTFLKKSNQELTKQLKNKGKSDTKVSKHENKSSPFLRFVGRMWWFILIGGISIGMWIRKFIPNPFKK